MVSTIVDWLAYGDNSPFAFYAAAVAVVAFCVWRLYKKAGE